MSTRRTIIGDNKKSKIASPIINRGMPNKKLASMKNGQPALQAAKASSLVASTVGLAGPMGMSRNVGRSVFSAKGTQAGAGAPNFSGTWQLDRENSDSTNDYLEAMGLPLIARQAADKLDLTVVIQQNDNDFIITRKTRIFTDTKHLKFGQDVVIKFNSIRVSGTPEQVETVSHLSGSGVLTDTRTLSEDQQKMFVVLELSNLPDKNTVVMKRVFKKLSDSTSTDIDDETLLRYEATVAPPMTETKPNQQLIHSNLVLGMASTMYLAYLPHKQSESVKQRYEEYMTRQLSILLQKSNGDFTKVWKSEAFQVFLDTFLQYFPRHFERKYTSEPLDICDYVFQIISRCMKLGLSLTTPQWLDICSIYPENPLPLAPKAAQNVQQELIETFKEISAQISSVASTEEAQDIERFLLDMTMSLYRAANCDQSWWTSVVGEQLLDLIVLFYEVDLPKLEQFDLSRGFTARIRFGLVQLFHITFSERFLSSCEFEEMYSVIDLLAVLTRDHPGAQTGSFIADWNRVCCDSECLSAACKANNVDATRVDYLLMILEQLPKREHPVVDRSIVVEQQQPEKSMDLKEKIQRVKDIFADLGDGFIQLCIEACDNNVERTINALLEDNLPDAVQGIERGLMHLDEKKPTPEPQMARPNVFDGDEFETAAKLDRGRVWIGKKPQAEKYEPKLEDKAFAALQRDVMLQYDEVPLVDSDHDEYDDDYNDEFDDYVPFGVNDNPSSFDAVKEHNAALRAKKADEEFWEGMRNVNRETVASDTEETKDEAEPPKEKIKTEVVNPKQRAYREKNKAKFGNHNRKGRALKKRS